MKIIDKKGVDTFLKTAKKRLEVIEINHLSDGLAFLTGENGKLKIESTDLELSISQVFEAEDGDTFEETSFQISEFHNALKLSPVLTIEVTAAGLLSVNGVIMKKFPKKEELFTDGINFNFYTEKEMEEEKREKEGGPVAAGSFAFKPKDLLPALKAAEKCAAKPKDRAYLAKIFLSRNRDSLEIFATNSYRLFSTSVQVSEIAFPNQEMSVSKQLLALEIFEPEETATLTANKNALKIETKDRILLLRSGEIHQINWKNIIPEERGSIFKIDPEKLLKVLKDALPFIDKKEGKINLAVEKDVLKISVKEKISFDVKLSDEVEEPMQRNFNPKELKGVLESLKAKGEKEVAVSLGSGNAPMMMTEGESLALLMPLKEK